MRAGGGGVGWVKIDDQLTDHRKVAAAGPIAGFVYVASIGYCNRTRSDGFVPRAVGLRLATYDDVFHEQGHPVTARDVAAQLERYGLWEPTEGGWTVHGYLEWQDSGEQIANAQSKARERMAHRRRSSPEVRENFARSSPTETETETETELPPLAPPSGGKPPTRRKPSTTLPPGWQPNDDHRTFAAERGVDLEFEAAKMRDYVKEHDWRKVDWDATFRNWLRRAAERKNGNGQATNPDEVRIWG